MKAKRIIAAAAVSAVFALSGCGTSAYVTDRVTNNAGRVNETGQGYADNTDTVQNGRVYKSRFATNALRSTTTAPTTTAKTSRKRLTTSAKTAVTPKRRVVKNAVTVPYKETTVKTTTGNTAASNRTLNRLGTSAVGGTARNNVKTRSKIRYANNKAVPAKPSMKATTSQTAVPANPLANLANKAMTAGKVKLPAITR